MRALKSEQRRLEEEARVERCRSKKTMEEALQDTQTLAGFDHETDLKLGLLHQQMKVTREFLRQYVNV